MPRRGARRANLSAMEGAWPISSKCGTQQAKPPRDRLIAGLADGQHRVVSPSPPSSATVGEISVCSWPAFVVVRFTWRQVLEEPAEVRATLPGLIESRSQASGPARHAS